MKLETVVKIVSELKTATPVSFDLITTESKMRKSENPYPNAKKHFTISGLIGVSYENAVNNQLGREDKEMDFESQKPVWMQKIGKNLGMNPKTGRLYVPIKVQNYTTPRYIHDGIDVTEKVKPFIRRSKSPKTQGKLDKKVIWRTPAVDSIKKARMLGMEIEID